MKVVIDSNIFVMCANPLSRYYIIFQKLVEGAFTLCITAEINFEYLEIFERKFNKSKAALLSRFLHESNFTENVEAFYKWDLIHADPDDNKYCDCCIAANADYIVTNDKHFGILKQTDFPKINVLDIDEFIKIIA